MRNPTYITLVSVLGIAASVGFAQESGKLIVTAEAKSHQSPAPLLQRDDISVEVDNKPARVTSWTPLTGDAAALQLYIVIDDSDSTDLGIQFGDLKNFINSQPPSTQIGIAYLRNGSAQIAVAPTADHARAAGALRLPLGDPGIEGSPYIALKDLFKKWPPADARREVLAIMSGIDPYYLSPDLLDPYLTDAIAEAQKANIVVSSIYYASGGHFGHSFYRTSWGQNYLSMLDEDLGGEFYWQGLSNPVSFAPFLKEFAGWLNNQYLLAAEIDNAGKPELKSVRITTHKTGVSLVTASKIYAGLAGPRSSK